MTTATTTLTDFLLARISDDERHARMLAETDRRPVLSLATTVNHPERLLAECEAKRQIISYCDMLDRGPSLAAFSEKEAEHARHTLRCLALPYADHPDYDEAWRP